MNSILNLLSSILYPSRWTSLSRNSKRSARTIRALYDCARFLASDHARLRSWWLASTIRIALRADAKCRPTSAWFHANSSPAKPIATGALRSAAIHWRAQFLSSAPGPRCGTTPGPKAFTNGSAASRKLVRRRLVWR